MVFKEEIVIDENKDRMKQLVTVNMPEIFYESLQKLVEIGLYPSKSEAIRVAVRDFFENDLEPGNFKDAVKHMLDPTNMQLNQECCWHCEHYDQNARMCGGVVKAGAIRKDAEDREPDDYCELYEARIVGDAS